MVAPISLLHFKSEHAKVLSPPPPPPAKESELTPQNVRDLLLPAPTEPGEHGEAFASANIALCKYWGKRDEALKLPLTGSLSVSLGKLGTRMRVAPSDRDALVINDGEIPPGSRAGKRLFDFLHLLQGRRTPLRVESKNTIPMGAGLASSASAFAAAVMAMEALYGWNLDPRTRSILARLGSGSACRSVFTGFVEWMAGTDPGGMDSHAVPVAPVWPDFRVSVLTLSDAEKPVGSTEGMSRTRDTAPLFAAWPRQVARDLPRVRQAVLDRDFTTLGQTAEQNALAMHATMIAAWPPLIYWQPETLATLHKIHALRAGGVEIYATLDAGPNVKLLHLRETDAAVRDVFPNLKIMDP